MNNTSEIRKTFDRENEKRKIRTCNIMGVNIAAVSLEWVLDYTIQHVKDLSGDYMCVANVHTTVTAFEEEDYCQIQNNGILAIPDGGPLSVLGRKRGYKEMMRTTGPAYMDEILKISAEKGYRHFFYGSTEETIEKIQQKVKAQFPDLHIVGLYSPPFREMTLEEDAEVIKMINDANPDFVWVGLGAPKQERWMAAHQGKVKGFMIGVGAGFDFLAGNLKRAPEWMQNNNLEWLFRLWQEPKRLFKRYWHTNWVFIWNACLKGK